MFQVVKRELFSFVTWYYKKPPPTVKIYLVVLMGMLTQLFSIAQENTAPCQIWLRQGTTASGNELHYETPILRPAVFTIDNQSFPASDVSFIQNKASYIGSLGDLYGFKSERYALRIVTGKMDIYEEIDIVVYTTPHEKPEESLYSEDPFMATGTDYQYYSLDKTNLKKFSYKNLKLDVAGNESSVNELKKFNRLRWLQRCMLTAAVGIITYDIASQDAETLTLTPVTAFGFILGGSSFFIERGKHDALMEAADAYNAQ